MPQAAPWHAHHHRDRPTPPVADLGRIVHELVETAGDEIIELHFAERPLTGERRADAHTEDTAFSNWRIDDAIAELREQRPQQKKRVAVSAADIFAVDEDASIALQRV